MFGGSLNFVEELCSRETHYFLVFKFYLIYKIIKLILNRGIFYDMELG